MTTRVHLAGQWIAIARYTTLDSNGKPKQEYDGGRFRIEGLAIVSGNTGIRKERFHDAFVSFEHLVNQNYQIGEHFTIDGQVSAERLAEYAAAAANAAKIAVASARLQRVVDAWAKKHVRPAKKADFTELTTEFLAGVLEASEWRADQQQLLFGDHEPAPEFVKFQQRLEPYLTDFQKALNASAIAMLRFTEVDNISTLAASSEAVVAPQEVHLVRDSYDNHRPMRLNFRAEWEKYLNQTAAFRG